MGWKILAVVLALIWISGIPDIFNEPQTVRDWIGRTFSTVGLVGLLAYAFGWSIMDQRFWFPFALAFAGWLSFAVLSTAVPWSKLSGGGAVDPATLVVAVSVPAVISFLQWFPVWRYANGLRADAR